MIAVALKGRLVIPLTNGSTDIEIRIRPPAGHHEEGGSGVRAKWKSSGSVLDLGERYEVTATGKAHGEYNGKLQTELTRCKARAVKAEAA